MKNRRCIKYKKILVGNRLVMCSSCKRLFGKITTGLGGGVLFIGGTIIKYVPKKKT